MKRSVPFFIALCLIAAFGAAGCSTPDAREKLNPNVSSSRTASNSLSSVSSSGFSSLVDSSTPNSLNSIDGQDFQSAAKKFTEAYLSGDIDTMKSCLMNPDSKNNHFNIKNRSAQVESLTLKTNPDSIKQDAVTAEYEIMFQGEDSFTYLYLGMKKVNNEWKVESYGLEK